MPAGQPTAAYSGVQRNKMHDPDQSGIPSPPEVPAQVAQVSSGEEKKNNRKKGHIFWYYQNDVEDFYHGQRCQIFVAGLIFVNFGITLIQASIDPFAGSERGRHNFVWEVLDAIFTAFFTVELGVNMYGSWCKPFWSSGWNIFDTVVVSVSIMVLTWKSMPGELQLIKLLRAFRVFRLFNRIPSMRKILQSLGKAIPGMVSAFGINILMMCIYSVLAVDLFKDLYEKECNGEMDARAIAYTSRGECYGKDYYGNFIKSWYTLFQVLTGESWSEAAVRPILYYYETDGNVLYWCLTFAFFLSFIVINALVLLNVVVALLMDGMSGGGADEQHDQHAEQDQNESTNREGDSMEGQGQVDEPITAFGSAVQTQLSQLLRIINAEHERELRSLRHELDEARSETARAHQPDRSHPKAESDRRLLGDIYGNNSADANNIKAAPDQPLNAGIGASTTAMLTTMMEQQQRILEHTEHVLRVVQQPYKSLGYFGREDSNASDVPMERPGGFERQHPAVVLQKATTQPDAFQFPGSSASALSKINETDSDEPEERGKENRNISKLGGKQNDKMNNSEKFDMLVGVVIVCNTFVMAMQLEYNGQVFKAEVLEGCKKDCTSPGLESFFFIIEHIFTALFAIELLIRLYMVGLSYLRAPANALDALIVIVSMADSWVLGPLGSNAMGNVAVIRLVRLLRLAKVLRVVRVMKAFASLRVLVAAVANSVGALGWSMALLFVLELIGAIFMAQVLKPFMDDPGIDADLQDFIFKRFGTWTNAMLTIFEVTMSPGGFVQYRRLYEEVHALFGIFFVIYVCLVTFAVVRVITAMFLKTTLAASSADEHANDVERKKVQAELIFSLKQRVISDNEVEMGADHLQTMFELSEFEKWMHEHCIEKREVRCIFKTLDRGNGRVRFDELATALTKMTSQPSSADKVISFYESRRILARLRRLESCVRPRTRSKAMEQMAALSTGAPSRWSQEHEMAIKDKHDDDTPLAAAM